VQSLNTGAHTLLIQLLFSDGTPTYKTSSYRRCMSMHGFLIEKIIVSLLLAKISDIPLQNTFALKKGWPKKLPVPVTKCKLEVKIIGKLNS